MRGMREWGKRESSRSLYHPSPLLSLFPHSLIPLIPLSPDEDWSFRSKICVHFYAFFHVVFLRPNKQTRVPCSIVKKIWDALWSRTSKNHDVNIRAFAWPFNRTSCSFASSAFFCLRTLLWSFIRSLAHLLPSLWEKDSLDFETSSCSEPSSGVVELRGC